MKNLYKSLITLFSLIIMVFTFQTHKVDAATYKPGDILVTNDTIKKGIVGHAAIVIDSKNVIHTSGWKNEPYPTKLTISKWKKRYHNKVKQVRPNSATLGKKAAANAKKYFYQKKIPYSLPKTSMKKTKYTYCSHLVWFSYYKAGKTFEKLYQSVIQTKWVTPNEIFPYDFVTPSLARHNGFKIIDDKF